MYTRRLAAAVALLVLVTAGCSSSGSSSGENGDDPTTSATADDSQADGGDVVYPTDTVVELHFGDASVPPEYHRSYTLTVTEATVHVVVDSYGEVVADERAEVSPDAWAEFLSGLPDALNGIGETVADEGGCTGGTTTSLSVQAPEGSFDRVAPVCGASTNSAAAEAMVALMAPFAQAVDLETLTATE